MDAEPLAVHVMTMPRQVTARMRRARATDVPQIEQLIALSWRALARGDYTAPQVEAALGAALGVDSQLVRDGTYFVAEAEGMLVACGGWSWRKTLFGSDHGAGREPDALDPARDPARIRAFFVHPDWVRLGLGRAVLELCESEAMNAGFTAASLMATLPGERLYRKCGYDAGSPIDYELSADVTIRFVPMQKSLTRGSGQVNT
jgi:GNAT superfamily N-acetyltransferase